MATRTPPIYTTGQWSVMSPFSIDNQAVYICKAIRSIDELEAGGVDPYVSFYQPHGLSRSNYNNDVKNLANIVTLMSPTTPTLYIPDTYIASYPDTTTMPYSHVVISASLGAVPDTLALDDALQKVEDTIKASTGINAEARTHIAGVISQGIDFITHQSLENQRLQRISSNTSMFGQLTEKDNEIARLRQQIQLLEQIVIDNGLIN